MPSTIIWGTDQTVHQFAETGDELIINRPIFRDSRNVQITSLVDAVTVSINSLFEGGIHLWGAGGHVVNIGASGSYYSAYYDTNPFGFGYGSHNVTLNNAGWVQASLDVGGNATVNNSGDIVGRVHIGNGYLPTGHSIITNSGAIVGNYDGFSAQVSIGRPDTTNTGTVINTGLIGGDVALSGGADTFDGRGGTVYGAVYGYGGDDTYWVNDTVHVLIENSGGGTDTVNADTSFRLADNFEDLILIGTDRHFGVGNASANTITGNDANNRLWGLDGADTLNGGDGNDILRGGAGADVLNGGDGQDWADYRNSSDGVTVNLTTSTATGGDATGDAITSIERIYGSAYSDELTGDEGKNILRGGAGADTLNGGDGNDVLQGGAYADVLNGGDGWDFADYRSSANGVTVNLETNTATGGDATGDTLSSIERIFGSAHSDDLTGDGGNNILRGGAGADTLNGGDGNDVLQGGVGADLLTGGDGRDKFVFNTVLELGTVDHVVDFSVSDGDILQLDDAYFAALTIGELHATNFRANLTGVAEAAEDRIIYSTSTGQLYFDADGLGGADAIEFAVLDNIAAIDASSFFVF